MQSPPEDNTPKSPVPTRFKVAAAGAAATLGTLGTWFLRADSEHRVDIAPPAALTSPVAPPPEPIADDPPKNPPQAVDTGNREERTPASLLDDPPYDPKFDRTLVTLRVNDEQRYLDCLHAKPSDDGKHTTLYIDLAKLGVPDVYPKDPHSQNQNFVFKASSYIDLELPDTIVRDEWRNTQKCLCINLANPGITADEAEKRLRSLTDLMARYPHDYNEDAMRSWMAEAAKLMDQYPPQARKDDTHSMESGFTLNVQPPGDKKWGRMESIRVDCYTLKDINKNRSGGTDRHR